MNRIIGALFVLAMLVVAAPTAPSHADSPACWGQATAVFAQFGQMGQHASQQPTPRQGLRNLARELEALGLLPDDSLTSLAQYIISIDPTLSVAACLE